MFPLLVDSYACLVTLLFFFFVCILLSTANDNGRTSVRKYVYKYFI